MVPHLELVDGPAVIGATEVVTAFGALVTSHPAGVCVTEVALAAVYVGVDLEVGVAKSGTV